MPRAKDGFKKCNGCKAVLLVEEFNKCKRSRDGLQYKCKSCDHVRQSDAWREKGEHQSRLLKARHLRDPRRRMLASARHRAKVKGLRFDLQLEDVMIPSVCPVLGIPIVVSDKPRSPGSPSLDRIDNNLGYVRGNVAVISNRANQLKADSTITELRALVCYVEAALCV